MKIKQRLRLEIKEIAADGSFEGMLSPYGNLDSYGDVVKPGAYTKTLQERGNKVPMLWQHKTDLPIGELTLEDRPDGLWCKGQLLMADTVAQRAYLFIKAKIVKGLSIGFESIKDSIENGVRQLSEIKLYEGSIVTFPANESALIASVKGRGEMKGDFNEELTQIQLSDAGYQMRCALSYALSSAIWAELTREEKIALTEAIIQQFAEAYMAFIPAYLDALTEMYGQMETWNQKRFETKAGRKISAATKETVQSAADHAKSANDILLALLDDEADADSETDYGATSKSRAARETKSSEPVPDHSAAKILDDLRSLIPAA